MSREISIRLPKPHPAQAQVIAEADRFNVLNCGRRWGKTTFGINRILEPALQGYPVAWFAPQYRQMTEVWRELEQLLKPITKRRDSQQHRIELTTGGVIEMWSLDSPDVARGRKYKMIVVDEAAMVPNLEMVWQKVLSPTLIDYTGSAWFLSTPRGLNYFWTLYQQGNPNSPQTKKNFWRSWSMPTSSNPFMPTSEIARLKDEMSSRAFAQEILAIFMGDGVGVFNKVDRCLSITEKPVYNPKHRYVIGVDWGRMVDFTAFCVLDVTVKQIVHIEQSNGVEYRLQRERLKGLYEQWHVMTIIAEQNSLGVPIIEELMHQKLPVLPWLMTNVSKMQAVDAFALALEHEEVTSVTDPALYEQLISYTGDRTPSGQMRFNAPDGKHDDLVIAVILAWQGCVTAADGVLEWMRRALGRDKEQKQLN